MSLITNTRSLPAEQTGTHFIFKTFLVVVFIASGILTTLAQNPLPKISVAERSDNNGYVVRMHLTHMADSFRVFQPSKDLAQVIVYQQDIDTSKIRYPNLPDAIDALSLHPIPDGLGIDIYFNKSEHFIADIYPDQNGKHLLVGLTDASREEVTMLTEGIDPIAWQKLMIPDDALATTGNSSDSAAKINNEPNGKDEDYYKLKDKLKFDRIVIDAGHGGKDPGAIGYRGVQEKGIVLNVAKKLGHYIEQNMPEVDVIYTREDDSFKGLIQRGTIANHAEGDLFVSLHCNSAANHRAHGSEVFFLGLHRTESAFEVMKKENSVMRLEDNDKESRLTEEDLALYELANSGYLAVSQEIAVRIDQQFANRAQRHSRGIKQAGFMVLYHASMPAVLVELGFISNPAEQRFLTSDYGQSIMASAIFRSIRNYKKQYDERNKVSTSK